MSILLSAYFPEGIVFAADKNVTLLYETPGGIEQDVEVGATTKVIPWTHRRAVVGYCGLGRLAGLSMEEWMRQFAAQTRDFDDLGALAMQMQEMIQRDFNRDHPEGVNINHARLIVHLGGFIFEDGVAVPAMYYISNVRSSDDRGRYGKAVRDFNSPSDQLHTHVVNEGARNFRSWLEQYYRQGNLVWFNNGLNFAAFNVFRAYLWQTLTKLRELSYISLPRQPSLEDRIAYCKMAVELFDSFFRHHFPPRYRSVGGGADAEWVPWPHE
jgi:hypothetical protein